MRAAVVVLGLALTGCVQGGNGATKDDATTARAPASVSAEGRPSESDDDGLRIVKVVARNFVSAAGEAINSGDTDRFLSLTNGNCTTCNAVAEKIRKTYGGEGYARSAGWRLVTAKVQSAAPRRVLLYGEMTLGRQKLFDGEGNVYRVDPALVYRYQLLIKDSADGWRVAGWDMEPR